MLPPKMIGPELPTLMVASFLTIQKMLSACAPFIRLNPKLPFTVKSPSIWITKTSLLIFCASNVKTVPVVVETVLSKLYTLLPVNVWVNGRLFNDGGCVSPKARAVLNAPSKSLYAAVTVGLLGNV